jgi:hypothetical protein
MLKGNYVKGTLELFAVKYLLFDSLMSIDMFACMYIESVRYKNAMCVFVTLRIRFAVVFYSVVHLMCTVVENL